MKHKIIFLVLLFLSAGLFSSSKEKAKNSKGICIYKCMKATLVNSNKVEAGQEDISPNNFFLFVAIKPI